MQLFKGHSGLTTRGVESFDSERMYFGARHIDFHTSLYTTRGATFGNSLMFGQLIEGLDKVHRLHGCPVDSHQVRAMDALIALELPLQEGGQVSCPANVFGAKVLFGHGVGTVLRDEPETRSFHALVVLKPGHFVELVQTYMVTPVPAILPVSVASKRRQRKSAAPATAAPVAEIRTLTTRVSFDGEKVTIS